jgi:hypothetical protein
LNETENQKDKRTTTTTDSYHSYHHPPPPPRFHLGEGVEQTFQYKATKIYHVDFEVARDFARFCHYLDPPLSASQGVQEAMEYYMMVRQKDLVCTAQFVVKPVMVEERVPEVSHGVRKSEQCGFHGCKEDAVGSGVWRGKETYALCAVHLEEAKSNPKEWNLTPQHGHTVPMDNSEQPEKVPRCSTSRNDSKLERALGHLPQESEQP